MTRHLLLLATALPLAAQFISKERDDFEVLPIDASAPIFTDDLAPVEQLTRSMLDEQHRETPSRPRG